MASVVKWNNESEGFHCRDMVPDWDDTRAINSDCKTVEQWQSQIVISLKASGWTPHMMMQLQPSNPMHWFVILQHEGLVALRAQAPEASEIIDACNHSKRKWLAYACHTLRRRNWTPTMIGRAWRIPKTNVYRLIELAEADARSRTGSGASHEGYGESTKEAAIA